MGTILSVTSASSGGRRFPLSPPLDTFDDLFVRATINVSASSNSELTGAILCVAATSGASVAGRDSTVKSSSDNAVKARY